MIVALCQINTRIGGYEGNSKKILDYVKTAVKEGAQIVLFPELTLSSYPCLDLLDRADFRQASELHLKKLVEDLGLIQKEAAVVFGAFTPNKEPTGRPIFNSAVIVEKGKITHVQSKRLLPSYDVFDETRYFEPGQETHIWQSPWGKVGISICEDAWFSQQSDGRTRYYSDPAEALKGSDFVLNLSASPFSFGKKSIRTHFVSEFAKRVGSPLFYVNQVGANDELIFDGNSRIFNGDGAVVFEGPSFVESLIVAELDINKKSIKGTRLVGPESGKTVPTPPEDLELRELFHALVLGIRDYFSKTGFKKAFLGLSGGIDSALVAVLAAEALGPENVHGYSLPSIYSSTHSLDDAEKLSKKLGIHYGVIPIKMAFSTGLRDLKLSFPAEKPAQDVTEENLQARYRGTYLMALANKYNGLVLCTVNKSESAVGYGTLYGDLCGALAPIGDLYKTQVYKLAHFINKNDEIIPGSTLTKPPSAELKPDQKDQDTLPEYDVLDEILRNHIEGGKSLEEIVKGGFKEELVVKVLKMVSHSEYKRRQAPMALRASEKAFGLGRRYPIAKTVFFKEDQNLT